MRSIPNKYREPLSREATLARWKTLANGGPQVIQESVATPSSRATLMFKMRGADGLTYGILQENNHFFLKSTKAPLVEAKASDFEYINGTQNILSERFNSASAAHRRLNAKLYSIQESVEGGGQEQDLLNKLNQKDDEEEAQPDNAMPPVDGGVPTEGGAPAADGGGAEADPLAGLEADMGGAGAEGGEAPAGDGGMPELDADLGGEGEATPEGGDSGEGDPNAEGGDEGGSGDANTDAMKTLGKLGQQLDNIGELSPEFVKTILNTVITKTKRALGNMPDEDKEKIQQRINKDGIKIDEDETLGETFNPNRPQSDDEYNVQRTRERDSVMGTNTPRARQAANINQVGVARRGDDLQHKMPNSFNKDRAGAAVDQVANTRRAHERSGIENPLKEDDMLPESDWDAYRDRQEDQYQNKIGNQGGPDKAVDFASFMDSNGYDGQNDDTTVKGIEAWSSKLSDTNSQPSNEDIAKLVGMMNPYVWGEIHQGGVSDTILQAAGKLAGVQNDSDGYPGEWPEGGYKPQPMHESWSSVGALTRLLVSAEINKRK